MSGDPGSDEVDLTASGDVVSAMSAAVARLRQLAAAAFIVPGAAGNPDTSQPEPAG